ncbi:MAG TPA: pyruvate dehydrogenase (acetyl-transferring) E1 component subunit alpha [Actinomycetota bacterium]
MAPSIEPVQLLSPEGALIERDDYPLSLDDHDYIRIHEQLVETRTLDREFVNLQRQGQLALFPSCLGQEAAQVGSAIALDSVDWIFPQYRELGVFVVRGVDPVGIGHMWRGTWHGGDGLLEKNCAPLSVPIGTHALHAVGHALGSRLLRETTVTVAYVGDGATSEGDVHEAMNFAAVFETPCLFFVQNNQWAISVPVSRQTRAPSIAHKAIAYGIPGIRCDGNDVLACYAVTRAAAERARRGEGPTLIEAVTYRLGPHTTSDDPTRYRTDDEVEYWRSLDPILRYEAYLKSAGIWSQEIERAAADKAAEAAGRLRAGIYEAPHGDPLELFDHVYSTSPPTLERQREQLRAELDAKGKHE